jgi:hypothetical protein
VVLMKTESSIPERPMAGTLFAAGESALGAVID